MIKMPLYNNVTFLQSLRKLEKEEKLKGCDHTSSKDTSLIYLTFPISKWRDIALNSPKAQHQEITIYVCCIWCYQVIGTKQITI